MVVSGRLGPKVQGVIQYRWASMAHVWKKHVTGGMKWDVIKTKNGERTTSSLRLGPVRVLIVVLQRDAGSEV